MRRHSNRRLDPAAFVSVVGTSLMAVVASSAGFDEPQAAPVVLHHRTRHAAQAA